MNRSHAIDMATSYFDDGRFMRVLAERVALHTESQLATSQPTLYAYLHEQMVPELEALGFSWRIVDNPVPDRSPFLIAERIEDPAALTVLPWRIVVDGDRWYGRGTADNKGQHTINLAALAQVIDARGGRLGYNVKVIIEMGEETGSPGLASVCAEHRDALAADLFIASDGPRVAASRPTMFLGSRGNFNFTMRVALRDGAHHSGNWGGLLRSPGIRLANALASMVDAHGRILVKALLPESLPQSVRDALRSIEAGGGPNDPDIDPDWGEPGLSPVERLFGWNALEVLAFKTGNPEAPVNAIPGYAFAHCQLRYVVGSDSENLLRHIREHLETHGFTDIEVAASGTQMQATRLDPDDPWVRWGLASIEATTGEQPALLPNLGGSLPNDVFAGILDLPTLWVPHSYAACSQHAPNEHLLGSVARQSLQIMAGLFWDLAEQGQAIRAARRIP